MYCLLEPCSAEIWNYPLHISTQFTISGYLAWRCYTGTSKAWMCMSSITNLALHGSCIYRDWAYCGTFKSLIKKSSAVPNLLTSPEKLLSVSTCPESAISCSNLSRAFSWSILSLEESPSLIMATIEPLSLQVLVQRWESVKSLAALKRVALQQ